MAANESTPLLDSSRSNGRDARVDPPQETQLSNDPPSSSTSRTRQVAPDLLRGILMLLMAIDHMSVATGAFDHGTGHHQEDASVPVDQWNSPFPFAVRTATHLVAPGFSMLMGMGIAYFVDSRSRQGWPLRRQLAHVGLRAAAIVVVNSLSIQLVQLLYGRKVYIANAVLLALAVDYLLVGGCYAIWVSWVEPALLRFWTKDEDQARDDGHRVQPNLPPSPDASPAVVHKKARLAQGFNAALVVLSAVTLWCNIWTSPNNGVCLGALSAQGDLTHHHSSHVGALIVASVQGRPGVVAIAGETAPELCSSPRRLAWELFIRPVTCTDAGVWSGFPPLGWMSFVLFGVAYGRVLLASRRRKVSALTINSVLAVFFAAAFVATRVFDWGNLSSHCLRTPDQERHGGHRHNQYMDSVRSFLYIVKYPPSPAFAFATMAGNFGLLALLDVALMHSTPRVLAKLQSPRNPLLAYGGQALFFYLGHFWTLYLIITVYTLAGALKGKVDERGQPHIGVGGLFFGGYLALLLIMYPACLCYGRWKKRRGPDSVWRFL
ncbi:unnamed protein product [Parajaminaea phylloscopi]